MATVDILNMDCMEYMATLPDKAFDLAIVDPPYGRGEHGGKSRTHGVVQKNGKVSVVAGEYVKKNWDNDPPGEEYIYSLLRVSKQQIIFGVNYIPRFNFSGGRIVWDKLNDGSDQSGAEIAYCSLNERVDIVRYMWRGMMQGERVGSFWQQGDKRINEVRIHPTQKPVALYRWLLENYATPGQRILDTHLGSGSSAIAAHYFGCDFVGTEIDEDYFSAAKKRFENETRQIDLLQSCLPHS